jgi:glycosyltransferase involved in cell wall biosynthesis
MTTLAVVIPLFNKRAFVEETIASLAAQDAPPDHLILVDDASTDGSADAAAQALLHHAEALRSTRVEWLRHTCNRGPGAARNSGLERADTELVLCLDADDCLRPDALRLIRESMDAQALAMMVLGFASDPPGETFPEARVLAHGLIPLDGDLFLLSDPLPTVAHPEFFMGRASNVVVRRSWLGQHRYCKDARLNEGVDLWYRVLKDVVEGGARAGLFAAPLIRFRISGDSLSHRCPGDWQALDVPPTVRRYRDSVAPHDRGMARMLADRWLSHALSILPKEQGALFLAHHRDLLAQLDVFHERQALE